VQLKNIICFFKAHNEARIVLRIIDQNDNSPKFVNESMPVIAAVSSFTGYGTPVATVQVSLFFLKEKFKNGF